MNCSHERAVVKKVGMDLCEGGAVGVLQCLTLHVVLNVVVSLWLSYISGALFPSAQ